MNLRALFILGFLVAAASAHAADFLEVCKSGSEADVVEAIKAGADLKAKDKTGINAFFVAAKSNPNLGVFRALIKAGVDYRAKSAGRTAMHLAAGWNPNVPVIEFLAKEGFSVTTRDDNGDTPVHHAAANNPNPKVLLKLVELGADIRAYNVYFQTPLQKAAQYHSNPEMLKVILGLGVGIDDFAAVVPPNIGSHGGRAIFEAAAWNPNPAVIRTILVAGADVKATWPRMFRRPDGTWYEEEPQYWGTPLSYAARHNNAAVISALLEAGADPSLGDGQFALFRAASGNPNPDAFQLLLEKGYSLFDIDPRGKTIFEVYDGSTANGSPYYRWKKSDPLAAQLVKLIRSSNVKNRRPFFAARVWNLANGPAESVVAKSERFDLSHSETELDVTCRGSAGTWLVDLPLSGYDEPKSWYDDQVAADGHFLGFNSAYRVKLTGSAVATNSSSRLPWGIAFNYRDQNNYDWVTIDPAGKFQIGSMKDGKTREVVPWSRSLAVARSAEVNSLALSQYSERLDVYINDTRVWVTAEVLVPQERCTVKLLLSSPSAGASAPPKAKFDEVVLWNIADMQWE